MFGESLTYNSDVKISYNISQLGVSAIGAHATMLGNLSSMTRTHLVESSN